MYKKKPMTSPESTRKQSKKKESKSKRQYQSRSRTRSASSKFKNNSSKQNKVNRIRLRSNSSIAENQISVNKDVKNSELSLEERTNHHSNINQRPLRRKDATNNNFDESIISKKLVLNQRSFNSEDNLKAVNGERESINDDSSRRILIQNRLLIDPSSQSTTRSKSKNKPQKIDSILKTKMTLSSSKSLAKAIAAKQPITTENGGRKSKKKISKTPISKRQKRKGHRLASLNALAKVKLLSEMNGTKTKLKNNNAGQMSGSKDSNDSAYETIDSIKVMKSSQNQLSKNKKDINSSKIAKSSSKIIKSRKKIDQKKNNNNSSGVEIIDTRRCKRMANLNASAIMAATYSSDKDRKTKICLIPDVDSEQAMLTSNDFSVNNMVHHCTSIVEKRIEMTTVETLTKVDPSNGIVETISTQIQQNVVSDSLGATGDKTQSKKSSRTKSPSNSGGEISVPRKISTFADLNTIECSIPSSIKNSRNLQSTDSPRKFEANSSNNISSNNNQSETILQKYIRKIETKMKSNINDCTNEINHSPTNQTNSTSTVAKEFRASASKPSTKRTKSFNSVKSIAKSQSTTSTKWFSFNQSSSSTGSVQLIPLPNFPPIQNHFVQQQFHSNQTIARPFIANLSTTPALIHYQQNPSSSPCQGSLSSSSPSSHSNHCGNNLVISSNNHQQFSTAVPLYPMPNVVQHNNSSGISYLNVNNHHSIATQNQFISILDPNDSRIPHLALTNSFNQTRSIPMYQTLPGPSVRRDNSRETSSLSNTIGNFIGPVVSSSQNSQFININKSNFLNISPAPIQAQTVTSFPSPQTILIQTPFIQNSSLSVGLNSLVPSSDRNKKNVSLDEDSIFKSTNSNDPSLKIVVNSQSNSNQTDSNSSKHRLKPDLNFVVSNFNQNKNLIHTSLSGQKPKLTTTISKSNSRENKNQCDTNNVQISQSNPLTKEYSRTNLMQNGFSKRQNTSKSFSNNNRIEKKKTKFISQQNNGEFMNISQRINLRRRSLMPKESIGTNLIEESDQNSIKTLPSPATNSSKSNNKSTVTTVDPIYSSILIGKKPRRPIVHGWSWEGRSYSKNVYINVSPVNV